jgi:hypothetical protein
MVGKVVGVKGFAVHSPMTTNADNPVMGVYQIIEAFIARNVIDVIARVVPCV